VQAVAFSPDGRMVATASGREVHVWDATTGKPIGDSLEHQTQVLAVVFSPDGGTLAAVGDENCATLWRLPIPVEGDVERIGLWVQVITGAELDEKGGFQFLDASTWQERRKRLAELGGAEDR
jgi:WD40 repeat protein